MKLWSIAFIGPRPHLDGFFQRDFVSVAVDDAVQNGRRTLLVEENAAAVDTVRVIGDNSEVGDQGRRVADGESSSKVPRCVMSEKRVGDTAFLVVAADEVESAAIDAIVVFKFASIDVDSATVEAQGPTDGTWTDVVAKIGAGDIHFAVDEAQTAAIHKINGIYFAIQHVVVYAAVMYCHG